jgi:Cytochrome c.
MKRNALLPYLLIMVFGLGLIVALSFIGLSGNDEAGGGGETVAQSPEAIYQNSCMSCHGQNYEGAAGPALKGVGERLSPEDIKDVIVNGRDNGSVKMPGGLVPADQVDAMVDWLVNLK